MNSLLPPWYHDRTLVVIIVAFINLFIVGNLESIPGSVQCEFAAL